MKKGFIIAIDGPLASGKGTIAKKLAEVLHGVDLYTGAMYRSVALYCINGGIDLKHAEEVVAQLEKITIDYKDDRILLNGTDVTNIIQEARIAEGASVIGVIPGVRKELVARQQQLGRAEMEKGNIVIVEGRDIGSVVFPDAALKIYLTAKDEVRAKRRLLQYQKLGDTRDFKNVLLEISERDIRDITRNVDPLPSDPAKFGYFILDNSDMNEEQTIETILAELKRRNIYD
jgi:CMP/dCMP kinase